MGIGHCPHKLAKSGGYPAAKSFNSAPYLLPVTLNGRPRRLLSCYCMFCQVEPSVQRLCPADVGLSLSCTIYRRFVHRSIVHSAKYVNRTFNESNHELHGHKPVGLPFRLDHQSRAEANAKDRIQYKRKQWHIIYMLLFIIRAIKPFANPIYGLC
jgi:hypothetical protein